MKDFKQLRIWQKGFDIAVLSYKFTQAFPAEERYTLTSQIRKSSISIPSNIAEEAADQAKRITIDSLKFLLDLALNLKHRY
jgi:four helix bundle protein